jgi:diaminopimelate epimerase
VKKLIQFAKVEATGNDFIAINAWQVNINSVKTEHIRNMCDRHYGVGADGLIIIDQNSNENFNFAYYNADGYKSTMCGNGSRAAVLVANINGMVRRNHPISFSAEDGVHKAWLSSKDLIGVEIICHSEPEEYKNNPFELPEGIKPVSFINTGVPHLVLEVEKNLESVNVTGIGSRLRQNSIFPEGTNVNFVHIHNRESLSVRTYERGVERETLSCGTGVTAAALTFWPRLEIEDNHIVIQTRGGRISVIKKQDDLYIEGAARVVFVGQYLLNS